MLSSNAIIYILIAVATLVFIVMAIMIANISNRLSKYSRDDYYKQALVKNDYVINQDACSNFAIYALSIDTNITADINRSLLAGYANGRISLPTHFYTIPKPRSSTASSAPETITIEYTPTAPYYIALKNNTPSNTRLVEDILGKRIEYLTLGPGIYRVSIINNYHGIMSSFLKENNYTNLASKLAEAAVIALTRIPTFDELKSSSEELSSADTPANQPQQIIHMFIGNPLHVIESRDIHPLTHAIGYRI